jgi:hypothetical protein
MQSKKQQLRSLNGFAHPDAKNASGVCGYGRKRIDRLIAALAASSDSSKNRCVVTPNVMRHGRPTRRISVGELDPELFPQGFCIFGECG